MCHIWGGSYYADFCKNRLSQMENCAILANVQKSETDVPQKDLSMVGTNLKASLFLQFPIEKKVIRIGALKKKKEEVCIVYNFKSFCQ